MKDRRLISGSDSRPIIGSDFGANITNQYRPAIIIQASIDHRSNIHSQHWLPTLRAWADHRSDHIFLHGKWVRTNAIKYSPSLLDEDDMRYSCFHCVSSHFFSLFPKLSNGQKNYYGKTNRHSTGATSFSRNVVLPKCHVIECQLVESSYCRIVKLPKLYNVECHLIESVFSGHLSFENFFFRPNNDSAKLHFGKTTIRWNDVSGKWCGPHSVIWKWILEYSSWSSNFGFGVSLVCLYLSLCFLRNPLIGNATFSELAWSQSTQMSKPRSNEIPK